MMKILQDIFTKNGHFNVFYALLLLAAVTLPMTTFLMLPIAILMLLNVVVEWNWRQKWQNIRQHKAIPSFFIFLSLYLIPFIGLILSFNKGRAMSCFDCYLWFFVAPVCCLTYDPELFTNRRIRIVLKYFAFSTILHACILLGTATYRLLKTGDTGAFYYMKLSFLRHPSYVAMYSTFTFFLLLYFIHHYKKIISLPSVIAIILSLIILLALIVLLQSKAGLIVFAILTVMWFVYFICHVRYKLAWGALFLALTVGLGLLVFRTDVLPVNRLQETITQVQHHKEKPYGHGSSEIRLTVWKSTLEIIRKNLPWGVGTGDATDELCLNAIHKNYTNLIGHHFNAHNQYLQTLLTVGIPGLIILLTYCFYPLYFSIRKKDMLYLSFAVILIFNLLVESMFEIRAGVQFFAIINVLLWLLSVKKNPQIVQEEKITAEKAEN